MAVLFVISCGSTPEAEPEPTVKDAVEEIKKDVEETVDFSAANKSLLALTEAARQSAIEFGAEKYFSDGFSVAETKYTSINNNVETDSSKDYSAEIKDLTARYNSLASASQASALKEKADALSLANENQKAYDDGKKALEEYSAFGIMFFDSDNLSMKPYVYVKEVGSGVYENSCASGTTALGYYLKKCKNLDRAKIVQPNGWLEYIIENDEMYIDGPVEIIAEGKIYIGK